ncbi:MAG: enoyl-CoA hydratase/isomerase family protein [Actinobacteria bacterium]|nr:enoyl-CoA hydratase/isomerase family protein [Actinomycetota bacterium]
MTVRTTTDGPVRTLTIDRAEQRNTLDGATLDGLAEGLRAAGEDDDVRVVVMTGAGDRAFCAGADLAGPFAESDSVIDQHEAVGRLRHLFAAVDELDKPLVGRVNGHAVAGGFGLALACDIVVAVEDATFGTPEVNVGLWPFLISALILDHLGPKRAYDLTLTGRRIAADEALSWGLVNRVVPAAELDEAVGEYVDLLVAGSPVAQRLGRRCLVETRDMTREQRYGYLHAMFDLALKTEDVKEGISAFLQKRDPEWPGR